jgi:hypothetical protein
VGRDLASYVLRAVAVGALGTTLVACSSGSSSRSSTSSTSPKAHGSALPIGTPIHYDAGGLKESVTLVQVVNPATEATYAHSPPPPASGQKYVGLMFKVRNLGKTSAVVQLGDQLLLEYSSGKHDPVTQVLLSDCPPFGGSGSAVAEIAPGHSVSGCVAFEAPTNVTLSQALLTSPDKTFGAWSLTKGLLPIFPG